MNKALFELLDEKDFKEITISEVCERANVNRSTFYAHYDNTLDLLLEAKDNFIAEFFSAYKLRRQDINNLSLEETNFITDEYLLPYLKFIKTNKKLYKIFMQNLNVMKPDDVMSSMLEAVFYPICKKHNVKDENIIDYMARYYLMGITSIILGWIERDCVDDYTLISEIITMCVRPQDRI